MTILFLPRWSYSFKDSSCTRVRWEREDGRSIHTDCAVSLSKYIEGRQRDQEMQAWMEQYSKEQAKLLIFFSNCIEGSGLAVSETFKLLSDILGDTSSHDRQVLSPRSHNRLFSANPTRNRQEVLQHGEAYRFLCIEKVHTPLTQRLIKETHRLLMRDLTLERDTTRMVRAGVYRTDPVYAGTHSFLPVSALVSAMSALCLTFQNDSRETTAPGEEEEGDDRRDPYSLAAQLCHDFVCIHPFEDGNGRMCRLLLNYALLHFGLPFPIALSYGVHKKAKSKYLWALRRDEKNGGQAKNMTMIVLAGVARGWSRFEENYRLGMLQPRETQRLVREHKLDSVHDEE